MSFNQNPFSVYDFLGYLIPGMLFCIGIYFIYQIPISAEVYDFNKFDNYQSSILLIIICYLLGHILSFLSTLTIEKYSVWTLGYPSTYLFKKNHLGFWRSIIDKYDSNHRIGSIIRIVMRVIMKILISLIILPVTLMDVLCRHLFRLYDQYARPFDNDLLCIVKTKIEKMLEKKYSNCNQECKNNDKQDLFRLVYHYSIENAPNHVSKMQNYVALYGFIRTTTFIFVIFFWNLGINLIIQKMYIDIVLWIPLTIIVTFILYLDFNKFYRKFSMETYLAAITQFKEE